MLELDEFMKDIGTSNQPKYSFLVPRLCPESQHPGCNGNITSGDDFIGEVGISFLCSWYHLSW